MEDRDKAVKEEIGRQVKDGESCIYLINQRIENVIQSSLIVSVDGETNS